MPKSACEENVQADLSASDVALQRAPGLFTFQLYGSHKSLGSSGITDGSVAMNFRSKADDLRPPPWWRVLIRTMHLLQPSRLFLFAHKFRVGSHWGPCELKQLGWLIACTLCHLQSFHTCKTSSRFVIVQRICNNRTSFLDESSIRKLSLSHAWPGQGL